MHPLRHVTSNVKWKPAGALDNFVLPGLTAQACQKSHLRRRSARLLICNQMNFMQLVKHVYTMNNVMCNNL